jgi:hypothetical protein
MAWVAAAHALGSRRRRIPQPSPSHFRRRLKTQDNHSPATATATAKSSLPRCLSGPTLPRAASRSGEFFRYMVWGLLLASAFFLVAIVVLTLLVGQWS